MQELLGIFLYVQKIQMLKNLRYCWGGDGLGSPVRVRSYKIHMRIHNLVQKHRIVNGSWLDSQLLEALVRALCIHNSICQWNGYNITST